MDLILKLSVRMQNPIKASDKVEKSLSAVAIIIMLILTPWPVAMMITAAVGIFGGLVFSRNFRQKGAFIILGISFAIGALIALALR